jgi:hypothetical protein
VKGIIQVAMNLDRQIKLYEACINRLEDSKRAHQGDPTRLENELNEAYEQISLLKIRKMMFTL